MPPFECAIQMGCIGQDEFHAIDKVVMRHAFDIQNTVGRFCDERVYQNELAYRCVQEGLDARREVAIRVSYRDFSKTYYADMIVETAAIYELKAVESLSGNHEKQLINYLLLLGVHHGKLVNFRPPSVEYRFVSTSLNPQARSEFALVVDGWRGDDTASRRLRDTLRALLQEWGAFLDIGLSREALIHFMGGRDRVVRPVDIRIDERVIGAQDACLVDDRTAWHLSAARRHLDSYRTHLSRFLVHTHLNRIHWINFNHHTITLTTLIQ